MTKKETIEKTIHNTRSKTRKKYSAKSEALPPEGDACMIMGKV